MRFTSDSQRKAMFASINGKFSFKPSATVRFSRYDDSLEDFYSSPIARKKSKDKQMKYREELRDLLDMKHGKFDIDYDRHELTEAERKEFEDKRNKEYLELYGESYDDIEYAFGDNNVIWTAEMGPVTRMKYLEMLKSIRERRKMSDSDDDEIQ